MKKILKFFAILPVLIFLNTASIQAATSNPFKEYYLLQNHSKYIKKYSDGYKIYAENCKVVTLKYNIDGEGDVYRIYILEGYLDIGYFVFYEGYSEDRVYQLVNKNTGEMFGIADYPVIYSSRKIIVSFPIPEMNHVKTAYKILPNKLQRIKVPANISEPKNQEQNPNSEVEKLASNKELVIKILKDNPDAIMYVSKELRDDKDVIMIAISKGRSSVTGKNFLFYASDRLKDDKEIVLNAVKLDNSALEYSSKRLKNDKDVLSIINKK